VSNPDRTLLRRAGHLRDQERQTGGTSVIEPLSSMVKAPSSRGATNQNHMEIMHLPDRPMDGRGSTELDETGFAPLWFPVR
jgi:hypothetical protein